MRLTRYSLFVFLLALVVIVLPGCQGDVSEEPPIHVVPNMDNQPKLKAQAKSEFFEDGAAMRTPVEGTVARGQLNEDDALYRGKKDNGDFVTKSPLEATAELLERGKERYAIFCAPCHGTTGDGKGTVIALGFTQPPDIRADSIVAFPDGQVFDLMTNGVRNMPAYGPQIPVPDRWAIIAHVRRLQSSHSTEGGN